MGIFKKKNVKIEPNELDLTNDKSERASEWRKQRLETGVSNLDWWNLDDYLLRVIAEGLNRMAELGCGYPGRAPYDTYEKWRSALKEHSANFLAIANTMYDFGEERDKAYAKFYDEMAWLTENFFDLWD